MKYLMLHETTSAYKLLRYGFSNDVIKLFNAQLIVRVSMKYPPKAQNIFSFGCFVQCNAEMICIDVT